MMAFHIDGTRYVVYHKNVSVGDDIWLKITTWDGTTWTAISDFALQGSAGADFPAISEATNAFGTSQIVITAKNSSDNPLFWQCSGARTSCDASGDFGASTVALTGGDHFDPKILVAPRSFGTNDRFIVYQKQSGSPTVRIAYRCSQMPHGRIRELCRCLQDMVSAQTCTSASLSLASCQRRADSGRPVLPSSKVTYEMSSRTSAMPHGGLAAVHAIVQGSGLIERLNARVEVLKVHQPYHESDHTLGIAYNVICGGQTLQDIELRRNDEVYLDALGVEMIPDPRQPATFADGSTNRRFRR